MVAQITAAEARKLGLDVKGSASRSKRTARGPYHTVCHACGEEFTIRTGENGEDGHVETTRHARYDLVLEFV